MVLRIKKGVPFNIMRSIVLVVMMVLTLYVAGMFRNLPLLVLFFVELFVLLLMWIFVIYFSLSVRCGFKRNAIAVERGTQASCSIAITNRAFLPVTKLRIISAYRYLCEKKDHENIMYGIADCGETGLDLRAGFNYAGMAVIKLKKLTIYDYLSLFSSDKKLDDELRIAVFPKNTALDIDRISQDMVKLMKLRDLPLKNLNPVKDARDEIKQVREYEPGDSSRNIHWNLSARMDRLWVREYDDENGAVTELFLDLRCEDSVMSISEYDSFFCVLTALLMGMLKKVQLVRVGWYGGSEEHSDSADIYDYGCCCDMLMMLYDIDFTEIDAEKAEKYIAVYESDISPGMRLRFDTRLSLRLNGEVLHRFDPVNWRNDPAVVNGVF